MARKKSEDAPVVDVAKVNSKIDDEMIDLIKSVNPFASYLADSALSEVKEWISSGNYALNAICSGTVYGGIAAGRITGVVGPSGTAKTYFLCKIAAIAQSMGYRVIYIDTETALDKHYANRIGCDVNNIVHIPLYTVEACKNMAVQILDKLMKSGTTNKYIMFIDSLGNLHTEKSRTDALTGNNVSEMGQRAKTMGEMMKLLTDYAAFTRTPIIYTNHIYADPTAMFPTIIQKQGGGSKVVYDPSLTLQLSSTQERAKKESHDTGGVLSNLVLGINIRALTVKNRFAKEFLEANIYLSQEHGMSKDSGLLELAVSTGVITLAGSTYLLGEQKIGSSRSFEHDAGFWDPILPELDKAIHKATSLCGVAEDIKLDESGKDVVEFNPSTTK